MSRTTNSIKNLVMNVISQLLTIICKIVTRTIFIQTLGKQYLGINGLFSNIITMLSLAELGFGTAITYNLYKPLAEQDKDRINALMQLYKKVYTVIGIIVLIIGLCLIPFLPNLISGDTSFININLIFILYLLQSVSSYLFYAYKSSLIKADQKEYKISKITYAFTLISNVAQIIILLVLKSFVLYVASIIICNVIQNLVIARKVDKLYPYINDKVYNKISKNEIKEIFKDCYALFIYKVNSVVLNATDNMVLSKYIGLEIVGMYSNYLIIVDNLKIVVRMIYNAVTASVGNLHATSDVEYENYIFRILNFATIWICGVASVGIFVVSNDFIEIWIGKDYLINQSFSLLLAINFYIWGLQMILSTYRNTMGLFQQAKYRPLFGMIINIVVSIILVQYYGIYGVIMGTIIANLATFMWFDPLIIYKHGFHMKVRGYYLTNIKYALSIAISATIAYGISMLFNTVSIVKVIVMTVICVLVTSSILIIFNGKTEEFEYIKKLILKMSVKIKEDSKEKMKV